MSFFLHRVAVIGSGAMGRGIAAHIANARIPVLLLDLPQGNDAQRNSLAQNAIDQMLRLNPCPFMSQQAASYITAGNLEDDFDQLATCDWIIEAVVEDLAIKQNIYMRLETIKAANAIVSSNTSTIPLKRLIEGRSLNFKQHFLIVHFFNPPRYMRLLEIIKGSQTLISVVKKLEQFCDVHLGKEIVYSQDTPGFIGNRIGMFWLMCAMQETINQGMTIEETDALFGQSVGIPKTGVFGLMDLIGLDVIDLIDQNMRNNLSPQDAYVCLHKPAILKNMLINEYTGRKGKGGFYRIDPTSDHKIKQSIDLKTNVYHFTQQVSSKALDLSGSDLKSLLSYPDRHGQFLWCVWSQVLAYTASLIPEVSKFLTEIDTAMKLGFNWKFGPFELLDKIGIEWFVDKMCKEGRQVPSLMTNVMNTECKKFYRIHDKQLQFLTHDCFYQHIIRPHGQLWLRDIKQQSSPLLSNTSASLWDIGDCVVCLEFHSKANTIDNNILTLIQDAIDLVTCQYKALILYNEGENFSAGANLHTILATGDDLSQSPWLSIDQMIVQGQQTFQALKYSPFPVVGTSFGKVLGGGCEILLHCDAIQAYAESYIGLVEVNVGLVPAWGGCKELLHRYLHKNQQFETSFEAIYKVFEIIGFAQISQSAFHGQELGYLRLSDEITMNRNRLLADAKSKALSLVPGYQPPRPPEFLLPNLNAPIALSQTIKNLLSKSRASTYDNKIFDHLLNILSNGESGIEKITENQLYRREHMAFKALIQNSHTRDRIDHMLKTGKSLKN